MIVIGPFFLLCLLLLLFRPIRLLAASALLTMVVIAIMLFNDPQEAVEAAVITQIAFWVLVAWSAHSKRQNQKQDIEDAVRAALAAATPNLGSSSAQTSTADAPASRAWAIGTWIGIGLLITATIVMTINGW
jgi:hypothetical protein